MSIDTNTSATLIRNNPDKWVDFAILLQSSTILLIYYISIPFPP